MIEWNKTMIVYKKIKGYTAYGNGSNCGSCGYSGYGKKETKCGWCTPEHRLSIKYFMDGTISVTDSDGLNIANGERYSTGVCSVSAMASDRLLRQKIAYWESLDELSDCIADIVSAWNVEHSLIG